MNEFYAEWSQVFIFCFFAFSFSSCSVLGIKLEVSWKVDVSSTHGKSHSSFFSRIDLGLGRDIIRDLFLSHVS